MIPNIIIIIIPDGKCFTYSKLMFMQVFLWFFWEYKYDPLIKIYRITDQEVLFYRHINSIVFNDFKIMTHQVVFILKAVKLDQMVWVRNKIK